MNSYSHRGRSGNYEKEMDLAFTLIFHNIKRLQDGVLSNSDPNLTKSNNHAEMEKKPEVAYETRMKKRSRSEPFLEIIGVQNGDGSLAVPQVQKSGSFNGRSLSTRRKVRFADDFAAEGKTQRSQQPSPLLKEQRSIHRHETDSISGKQKGHAHRSMK